MKKISTLLFCLLLTFVSSAYEVSAAESREVSIRYTYDSKTLNQINDIPRNANVIIEGDGINFSSTTAKDYLKDDLLKKLKAKKNKVIFHIKGPEDERINNYRDAIKFYSKNNTYSSTFVKGFEFEVTPTQNTNDYEKVVKSIHNKKMNTYARLVVNDQNTSIVASDVLKLFKFVTIIPKFTTTVNSDVDSAYKTVLTNAKSTFSSTKVKVGVEIDANYQHTLSDSSKKKKADVETIETVKSLVKSINIVGDIDYDDAVDASN